MTNVIDQLELLPLYLSISSVAAIILIHIAFPANLPSWRSGTAQAAMRPSLRSGSRLREWTNTRPVRA